LIEPTEENSSVAKFLRARGGGIHHIALRVPDLERAVDRLRSAGARLVNEQVQIGAEGYHYVFVHPRSTQGVLLELIQE
jgi:methylmalonyl-CoA epimerase